MFDSIQFDDNGTPKYIIRGKTKYFIRNRNFINKFKQEKAPPPERTPQEIIIDNLVSSIMYLINSKGATKTAKEIESIVRKVSIKFEVAFEMANFLERVETMIGERG